MERALKFFRGLGDIVVVVQQLLLQILLFKHPFGVLEIRRQVDGHGCFAGYRRLSGWTREKQVDLLARHHFLRTHDGQSLDEIAELSDISRPGMPHHYLNGLV